jgi:hypothetical protein
MRASSVFLRYSRLRKFSRATTYVNNQNFDAAKSVLNEILEQNKFSVPALILLADILLFQEMFPEAFAAYVDAKNMLETRDAKLSVNDRKFLTAYIDFRKLAVRHRLGSFDFSSWKIVADQIREMKAAPHLKRAFGLPEPPN